jgi:hypothetical protein
MNSPFKFLDAYTLRDKDAFFGRGQEVEQLFEMTTENQLLLIYGQSGTGKTSLVQCGLAGRFYPTDWYPIFIRRNDNINTALREVLSRTVSATLEENLNLESPAEMVEELYAHYLRPIYLIFDQLEELFILGAAKEQAQFIQTIAGLLAANLPCRILFILREEYLAHLYGFEKAVPSLFDRRLRVEPMSLVKVEEVIRNSCAHFGIRLEAPADNVQQILDNISVGKSGIQLPYLQVYLDQLWREAAKNARLGSDAAPTEVVFTTAVIQKLGDIEQVLPRFLEEQERQIWLSLSERHPELEGGYRAVRDVLDVFVTEEGTKRPVPFETRGEQIEISDRFTSKFPLQNPMLSDCIKALENSRILRVREGSYELAHDSLAAMIDEGRTEEQRQQEELAATRKRLRMVRGLLALALVAVVAVVVVAGYLSWDAKRQRKEVEAALDSISAVLIDEQLRLEQAEVAQAIAREKADLAEIFTRLDRLAQMEIQRGISELQGYLSRNAYPNSRDEINSKIKELKNKQ